MAPHSSTLAWKIPWTEEPGRLQSMGSLRVGHDWATSLSHFTFMHWRRKWQPTPVFLPGESQGQRSLVAAVYGVTQSRIWLKRLSSSSSSSLKKKCFAYFVHKVSWDIPCSWLLYWHHRKAALLRVIYCGKRQRSGKRCSHRHPWHLGWHHAPAEESHTPLLGILWPVSVVPRNRV